MPHTYLAPSFPLAKTVRETLCRSMLILRTLERPVVSTQGILNNKTTLQHVEVALWQPRSQPVSNRKRNAVSFKSRSSESSVEYELKTSRRMLLNPVHLLRWKKILVLISYFSQP